LSNKVGNAYRLYDNKTGFIPGQPADFYVPKYFIECKDTKNPKGIRKCNFSKKQIAKQRVAESKGIKTFYYIYFNEVKRAVFIPGEVIYKFFFTKGKGVLTWQDVKDVAMEELDD
jgi:penicillin-binding protein-related factor A (putative recombinase)